MWLLLYSISTYVVHVLLLLWISLLAAILTPTVELNTLVMKRGEQAKYTFIDQEETNDEEAKEKPTDSSSADKASKPETFYVSLEVGTKVFKGKGNTLQAAKHNAASNALKVLKVRNANKKDFFPLRPEN